MKTLIIAPSWIGDTIMAQPLFARLQAKYPAMQIDALAPTWVAPVLRRMPEISEIRDNPFAHGQLRLGQRWALGREIALAHYDAAYILPNSLKSALLPLFAGIPTRVGFTGEARYGLLNRRHHLDKAALPKMVERFVQLAEAPGTLPAQPISYPRLRSTVSDQEKTLGELALARPEKMIAFCPGAEYGPAKRWPATHFAELAQALSAQGYTFWLFGSPKDRAIAEEISALAPGLCTNLCGTTTLEQAIDLLAMAQLVVCNDSGLMHVAAALARPLVALYGSSSPGFTPPLTEHADIVSLNLACSPCFKRTCPLGHLDCLNTLSAQTVLAHCQQRLGS